MRFLEIIYLDPSLISEAYTEITGVSPVTKLSKSEDLAGSIGAGIFHLGGTTRESREFAVSTTQMFRAVEERLRQYPSVSAPEAFSRGSLFWSAGFLGVGSRVQRAGDKVEKQLRHFTIGNSQSDFDRYLDLTTKDEYFTSGYDRMAAEKEILGFQIWEPIEALLRPAFSNQSQGFHMFTPLVIVRNDHAEQSTKPTLTLKPSRQ